MKYTVINTYGDIVSMVDIVPFQLSEIAGTNTVIPGFAPSITARYVNGAWVERPPAIH